MGAEGIIIVRGPALSPANASMFIDPLCVLVPNKYHEQRVSTPAAWTGGRAPPGALLRRPQRQQALCKPSPIKDRPATKPDVRADRRAGRANLEAVVPAAEARAGGHRHVAEFELH